MEHTIDSKRRPSPASTCLRGALATAIGAVLLTACGGGSSGSQPGTPDTGGSGSGSGSGNGGSMITTPIIYLAGQDAPEITELYMADADSPSGSIRISGELAAGGHVRDFEVSPDGSFVVYGADENALSDYEVFLVHLANPRVSTRLNAPLPTDRDVTDFIISPDGSKVLYRAEPVAEDVYELFLVDVANPGAPVKMNAPLVEGGSVRSGYSFSPDGSKILYRADQEAFDKVEIFLVDVANPGVAQKVNGALTAEGDVASLYVFSPDGATIGYLADQEMDERRELFAAPVAKPGESVKLNGPLTNEGDVCRFEFSHDSTRVAYCGDQEKDGVMELFLVSLDAPGVSQKLNPELVEGGRVGVSYDFNMDDTFIVYEAEQDIVGRNELYRVDLAAPGVATKLNAPIVEGGGIYSFNIRSDSERVVYNANQEDADVWELFDVDLANPGVSTKLSPAMAADGVYEFEYSADSEQILYTAAQDRELIELYRLTVATPGSSAKLNEPLMAGGDVVLFRQVP